MFLFDHLHKSLRIDQAFVIEVINKLVEKLFIYEPKLFLKKASFTSFLRDHQLNSQLLVPTNFNWIIFNLYPPFLTRHIEV
jgi:hypothetical protein